MDLRCRKALSTPMFNVQRPTSGREWIWDAERRWALVRSWRISSASGVNGSEMPKGVEHAAAKRETSKNGNTWMDLRCRKALSTWPNRQVQFYRLCEWIWDAERRWAPFNLYAHQTCPSCEWIWDAERRWALPEIALRAYLSESEWIWDAERRWAPKNFPDFLAVADSEWIWDAERRWAQRISGV